MEQAGSVLRLVEWRSAYRQPAVLAAYWIEAR